MHLKQTYFPPHQSGFKTQSLLHTPGKASQSLRPLCEIPHCFLPLGTRACLNSRVAYPPLKASWETCPGETLTPQIEQSTLAHSLTRGPKGPLFWPLAPFGISHCFPMVSPTHRRIPWAYSPPPPSTPFYVPPRADKTFSPYLDVLRLSPEFNFGPMQNLQIKIFESPKKNGEGP